MNSTGRAASLFASLGVLVSCGSQPAAPALTAPEFTAEEKAVMTVEEKLAIYNANLPEKKQLTCAPRKMTGSHLPSRDCSTAEERHLYRESAQSVLRGQE